MFVKLFSFVLGCFIIGVIKEDPWDKLKAHPNFHLVHSDDDCGQVKINEEVRTRILNGETAQRGKLPWMAHVIIQSDLRLEQCGGSVINEHYILTAAHCFDDGPIKTVAAVLGLYDKRFLLEEGVEIMKAKYFITHPDYDAESSVKNDIALIRLEGSINFESPYINYICLPTSREMFKKTFFGENLTVSGWGFMENDTFATTLQKVEVPVNYCRTYDMNGKMHSIASSQLCAGSGRKMACGGDSGGPLTYETTGRVFQVGVLSFGTDNCYSSNYRANDVYSRVSSFMGWILDNLET